MSDACLRRSVFSLGVVPPLLLLIPNAEANERYSRIFYRCDNGQTLVSRVMYEDQMGTGRLLAVYPYPIDERHEVLWITKGRQFISVGDQQYDCNLWGRGDDDSARFSEIPDQAALRKFVQRDEPSRLICTGGTAGKSVQYWVSDFLDDGYRHGLMVVDGNERFGKWYFKGESATFTDRGKIYLIQQTYRPTRLVNGEQEERATVVHYLIRDNEYHNMSVCEVEADS